MKLNQLEIFCRILELGSFSKAAEALHLSQPTLTEHIKSLEDYLGTSVLDRLGREVVPTKAGELLYDYGKRILILTQEAEEKVRGLRGDLMGELKMGASTIPGEYILPPLIKVFRERFPRILINVIISDTRKVIAGIVDNVLELGIVGAKVEDPKLEYYKFARDELLLVAPSCSPWNTVKSIDIGKLNNFPFVLREEGSGTRMVFEKALKGKGSDRLHLNVVSTLGSTAAVIQAIKSGMGCSVLSRRAVQEYLDSGVLRGIPIGKKKISRDFHLVLRKGRARSSLCNHFFNFLLHTAKSGNIH